MTAITPSFHQNFTPEKKPIDTVEKDIRKWVESVCEFKANLDKQRSDAPLEKHLKKIKKFKIKKKASLIAVQINSSKNNVTGGKKKLKVKKGKKGEAQANKDEKVQKKETPQLSLFDQIKETFRNVKLPQNWTSGMSNGRLVFNKVKVTSQNAQHKVVMEKSLVITKDRAMHVLIKGSEVTLTREMPKVETPEDIKKAIRDIDGLILCEGPPGGEKSPQCCMYVDNKAKVCPACKSETAAGGVTEKEQTPKKTRNIKKPTPKGIVKQKSFQK